MAGRGRPPLRIGQHGKIVREYLGGGVWLARARFRDSEGVTRRVQRLGPADEVDKYGKLAEDALLAGLAERRPPTGSDSIGLDTLVSTLLDQHIQRLAEDGRSIRTLDTYRYDAGKLAKVHWRRSGGGGITRPPRRGVAIHARDSRADDGPGARARCYAVPFSSRCCTTSWEPTRSATCSRSDPRRHRWVRRR
jgi:hypothetical protein